jgi:hypothetical protein
LSAGEFGRIAYSKSSANSANKRGHDCAYLPFELWKYAVQRPALCREKQT